MRPSKPYALTAFVTLAIAASLDAGCGVNTALPVEAFCRHSIGIEICNGLDDDCNGLVDDTATVEFSCPSQLSCREGACCSDEEVRSPNVDLIDLLFMVDNSNSMKSKQEKLRRELPYLVRALVTGDVDGDGAPDPGVKAFKSVRVGVITSDMGVQGTGVGPGPAAISTCGYDPRTGRVDAARANYGDDGVLRTQVHRTIDGEPVLDPTTGRQVTCDHAPVDGREDTLSAGTMPAYLTFDATPGVPPAAPAVDAYVDAVACFTAVGVGGCGFEQQLESTLKAITPASRVPFEGGFFVGRGDDPSVHGVGHGDDPGTNGSWFREDAVLAVVLVTDEDDCSARDPVVFDGNASPPYDDHVFEEPGHDSLQMNTRCNRFPDTLHSVQRYVLGLLATRAHERARLFFGAITGVPPALTDDVDAREGVDNLDDILAAPEMQVTLVPHAYRCSSTPGGYVCPVPGCVCDAKHEFRVDQAEVVPVCRYDNGTPVDTSDDDTAAPGTRIVEVAESLHESGVSVVVQSICQPDFRTSIRVMLRDILHAMPRSIEGACLERPQTRDAIGDVDCEVHAKLAVGDTCSAHAGMSFARMEGPQEVCSVQQVPIPDATRATGSPPTLDGSGLPAHGWYYDDYTSARPMMCTTSPRLAFTPGDELPPEAAMVFTCCEAGRVP